MDMNHIGRQPGAVQPTRKRKKHAYAVMVSVLTGLFLLTAVSGALRLAGIIYFPWEPNAIGSSAAIYGPATVFGLCPQEGSVSLLSERIFFSDQGQDAIEYRVSLDEKASFLLPVARRYQERPEILVDGVKINVTVSEHPTAYVTQPMSTSSDRILGQSVHFIPNYLTMSQQPDDSYRLLIDSIDASPADLSLSDSFLVFDLSDAPTGKDAYTTTASPSFSVTGDPQQLRMLFVDGDCKISRVDKNYRDTGAGTASFYLTARSGRAAQKQWLALPEDDSAHALLVCVGGAAIPGRVMTLGEILTEAPGVDEEDQPAFLANLNRRLAGAPLDGSATLVDIEAGKPFDRVSSGGNSMVDLCQFAIDQPGEHTIAVTVDAPPESDCVSLPWYVYAASPASMWASVDERCATVQTRGGEYTYPIGDALFRFTPPPNQ